MRSIKLDNLPQNGRLAIVRFSALGDAVLASAAIAAIQAARPDLEITVCTKDMCKPVFKELGNINILTIPNDGNLVHLWQLAKALRAWNPDVICDWHATLRARLLKMMMPLQMWLRYNKDTRFRQDLIAHKTTKSAGQHVVDRYLATVELASLTPSAWLPSGNTDRKWLVLAPGAKWPTKQWPIARWNELADWWTQHGGQVLWIGSKQEKQLVEERDGLVGEQFLFGAPLAETFAALREAVCVVANDSAVGHLAAAVGTPTVTIFGPTVPAFGFVPWGDNQALEADLDCRPCSLHGSDICPLGHHRCMLDIEPEAVKIAIQKHGNADFVEGQGA